jgi:hypothetical protein
VRDKICVSSFTNHRSWENPVAVLIGIGGIAGAVAIVAIRR